MRSDQVRHPLSRVLSNEINGLQHQLNTLIIAKEFKANQEDNSVYLSDNIGDLKASNNFLNQKTLVFSENNHILGKANENLREQLIRYNKLARQLESEVESTQKAHETFSRVISVLNSPLERDEELLSRAKHSQNQFTKELESELARKQSVDRELAVLKVEIISKEQSLSETCQAVSELKEREIKFNEERVIMSQELHHFETNLNTTRVQNELLKSEIDELTEDVHAKELRNGDLSKQREQLEILASQFCSLRIQYTERLNEYVIGRNIVVKKLTEDNGKLDSMSRDADRTISYIKGIL
jgi:chromosome segregation ATPase